MIAVWVLSKLAVRNLFREKILYNVLFVAAFLLLLGYFASLLVWGRQDRVLLHFGTLVNALALVGVATGAGTRALRTEIEDRTSYLILSRPVHRSAYYVSKWFGIGIFSFLYAGVLSAFLVAGLKVVGGGGSIGFFQSMGLLWIESLIAASIALLLSLFLKPGLSSVSVLAVLFLGHNHEQLVFLKNKGGSPLLSVLQGITPDLSVLLMDTRVYYELPLSASEFLLRAGYGMGWSLVFVFLGNAVFFRKNL